MPAGYMQSNRPPGRMTGSDYERSTDVVTTTQGLAPQCPAPPQPGAPPPQDTADEANGFAELIAATLAAANEEGAASTDDAGTREPAVGTFDPPLALKQLLSGVPPGQLTEEGSQQVAWPDRTAEAGTAATLTTGTTGTGMPVPPSLVGVPSMPVDASLGMAPSSQALARPLTASTALPSAGGAGAQTLAAFAQTGAAQAGAQQAGVVPSPSVATAGAGTPMPGGEIAPAVTPSPAGDAPYGLPAPALSPDRSGALVRPQQAGVPGEGVAARGQAEQAVRASGTEATGAAALATATAGRPQQAQARAAGPGGFASGSDGGPVQLQATGPLTAGDPAASVAVIQPPAAGGVAGGVQTAQAAEATAAANGPPLAQQLADTVERAVRVGPREFRMQLSPPELGQVEIRIVETANGVRVSVETALREASELIQQHLPLLRAALEARDLRVGSLDVSHAGLADADEPGAQSHARGDGDDEESPPWSPLAGMEQDAQPEQPRPATRVVAGGVDLMA